MNFELANLISKKVLEWMEENKRDQGENDSSPFIVGISGPQGIGKSTLTQQLETLLSPKWNTLFLSIDDFYYPFKLLGPHRRGPPGTHDLTLLYDCLKAIRLNSKPFRLPKFDKTLNEGNGDRKELVQFDRLPLDVVFIEGWLLGFRDDIGLTNDKNTTNKKDTHSKDCDELQELKTTKEVITFQPYERSLDYFNAFIHLIPFTFTLDEQLDWIKEWRMQSEHVLNESSVHDLVERIWPYYQVGFPLLLSKNVFSPNKGKIQSTYDEVHLETNKNTKRCHLQVFLDRTRKVVRVQEMN